MEGQETARAKVVRLWLESLGLEPLVQVFEKEGFDDVAVIQQLSDTELQDLGISRMGDRKKILLCAASSRPGPKGLVDFSFCL